MSGHEVPTGITVTALQAELEQLYAAQERLALANLQNKRASTELFVRFLDTWTKQMERMFQPQEVWSFPKAPDDLHYVTDRNGQVWTRVGLTEQWEYRDSRGTHHGVSWQVLLVGYGAVHRYRPPAGLPAEPAPEQP